MKRYKHHHEDSWQVRVFEFAAIYAIRKHFGEEVVERLIGCLESTQFKESITKNHDLLDFNVNPIIKSMNYSYMKEYYSMEVEKIFYDNMYNNQCVYFQNILDQLDQYRSYKLYLKPANIGEKNKIENSLLNDAKMVVSEMLNIFPLSVKVCYDNSGLLECFNDARLWELLKANAILLTNNKQLTDYISCLSQENSSHKTPISNYTSIDQLFIHKTDDTFVDIEPSITDMISRFDQDPSLVEVDMGSTTNSNDKQQTPRTSLANFLRGS